mmetsp:Transcript_34415/g.83253  ORF Transcript_34415/g.83253 Transcript_34415/m.83253 type:complete len:668 (-) Transcript_34415:178-2181(-)|eukprot:CAMPEP_0181101164 /NCGR_PEP_ID=MMETSP1071-20121207/13602_1 /TAXON_ID=35127 /ORGANISM="Thalassiosira sp., Strain NH16" /LENGTH=667 /DNA_ID=CAMNT_0023183985 /DNA_START=225 /DNA_END=2228 /DNA_ORIENTATION=-
MISHAHANRLLHKCSSSSAAARSIMSWTSNRSSAQTTILPALSSLVGSPAPSSQLRSINDSYNRRCYQNATFVTAASVIGALLGGSLTCQCEASSGNCNSNSDPIDEENEEEEDEEDNLPTYTMAQVTQNNGKGSSKRVWMTYGGCVYDTTDFIANHPGGSEKILLAAGGPIEPHWHLFRIHFATDLPQQFLEKMLIGNLHPTDQEKVDDDMEQLTDEGEDPYGHEPSPRSPLLKVHSEQSMNAEVDAKILRMHYITPISEFYIRHHHPVPLLSEKDVDDFRLDVDLSLLSTKTLTASENISEKEKKHQQIAKLSLEQIKSLPKVEVTTTLQCSGNRRSGFNSFRRTSGTPWGQGAISTAKWGGARLADVLFLASEQLADNDENDGASQLEPEKNSSKSTKKCINRDGNRTLQYLHTLLDDHPNLQHLRFESLDGMLASIPVIKALSPFGDVIVAYEMNDWPLPRDHGYPLRIIVPGYAAVRNVKWLSKLEMAEEEALGPWQRGLNYKVLPPGVLDAKEVDLAKMPGLGEVAIFSGITHISRAEVSSEIVNEKELVPGETVMVKASGWAWAGGGRNIVRVDVTGDNGQSWSNAEITLGSNQQFGRAWAWVHWECPYVPAKVCDDGTSVELSCKAVDTSFNTQPESSDGIWNVRGLANNSWYRLRLSV